MFSDLCGVGDWRLYTFLLLWSTQETFTSEWKFCLPLFKLIFGFLNYTHIYAAQRLGVKTDTVAFLLEKLDSSFMFLTTESTGLIMMIKLLIAPPCKFLVEMHFS